MWLSLEMGSAGRSMVSKIRRTTFCCATWRVQWSYPRVGEPGMLHSDYRGPRETLYTLQPKGMTNNRTMEECKMNPFRCFSSFSASPSALVLMGSTRSRAEDGATHCYSMIMLTPVHSIVAVSPTLATEESNVIKTNPFNSRTV